MYSKEYLEFIQWCKNNNFELSLTRTQYEFVSIILKENEKIGDFRKLITALTKFING